MAGTTWGPAGTSYASVDINQLDPAQRKIYDAAYGGTDNNGRYDKGSVSQTGTGSITGEAINTATIGKERVSTNTSKKGKITTATPGQKSAQPVSYSNGVQQIGGGAPAAKPLAGLATAGGAKTPPPPAPAPQQALPGKQTPVAAAQSSSYPTGGGEVGVGGGAGMTGGAVASPSMQGFQTAAGPQAAAPSAAPFDALQGATAQPLRPDLGQRQPPSLQALLRGKMY